jgi:hypothetical protein
VGLRVAVGIGVGVTSAVGVGVISSSSSPPHALTKGKATTNKVMKLMNATFNTGSLISTSWPIRSPVAPLLRSFEDYIAKDRHREFPVEWHGDPKALLFGASVPGASSKLNILLGLVLGGQVIERGA